jgi:NAD(P)-dependent dehydrogenase (short-subunit alcohol dehydrogenase family)
MADPIASSATPDLSDRIALVTGASRGAGAAIAAVLGEGHATVYVTGRSSREGTRTEGLPGTVEDSAAEVTARGGTGIPVVCDHTDAAQVEALVARIAADHGRLDVLVNNAWGGYAAYEGASFVAPFWEQPLQERWDAMFGAGVWPTMLTSARAAPLLPEGGSSRARSRGRATPTSAPRSTTRPRPASHASPSPWHTTCARAA